MAAVALIGIKKSFGSVPVLRGIDFSASQGEFVVLLGPSGCGKSTLLRIVAGLEDPDHGEIYIAGQAANDLDPRERGVAMVFQNYALYPHMNVAENMGFALRMSKMPTADIQAKVKSAAETLGLSSLLARLPKELSGGQRQRVAMGRALVRETALFLFDEPLSNLDAKLRVQMRIEIRALHNRLGVTSLYVTHDQIEAMTLADRVVVMRDGVIEQVGSPFEVYDRPASIFVAQFLGSPAMNLLSASAVGPASVLIDDYRLNVDPACVASKLSPGPVTVGIRPQDFSLAQVGGIAARVIAVEPTGSETLLHCEYGPVKQRICAAMPDRLTLKPGENVRLIPSAARLCVFDAASERRL